MQGGRAGGALEGEECREGGVRGKEGAAGGALDGVEHREGVRG